MRLQARTILFSVPVLIVLGLSTESRAQPRSYAGGIGIGVGVGYGFGYGPYWGRGYGPGLGLGYGPGWGWGPGFGGFAYQPPYNFYNGTWGNGLSLYGPPVPTGKPIPGMFGGGDSRFFPLPPAYPGWSYLSFAPLSQPGQLPAGVFEPGEVLPFPGELLPPPAPALDRPAPLEMEVRLPREDALVFIDGEPTKSVGAVRMFASPSRPTAEAFTYEVRAEWKVDGLTTTLTRRVTGHAGERVVVEFTK